MTNNFEEDGPEAFEKEELDRKINRIESRFWKKKEAALEAAHFFLTPFLSAGAYQKYNGERKRFKALEERKAYLMRTLPDKLGLTGPEKILVENAIETVLAPKSAGEEWDFETERLEDIKVDWVCRELGLTPGDAITLTAEPFTGKTHLATYFAVCFIFGKPIFGKYKLQKTGKVAHLNYDSHSVLTRIGYQRLANGLGVTLTKGDVYYEKPAWKFNQEAAYDNLTKICTGKALCIIDSLRTCYDGEENSSEVANIIAKANKVSEETGCVIMFLAHTGKEGVAGHGLNAMRGSSAFGGAVGSAWNLEKTPEDRTLKISCPKSRWLAFNPILYKYEETGQMLENIGKTSEVRLSFVGAEVPRQTLEDKFIEALKDGELTAAQLSERVGGNERKRSEAKKKLIEEKVIEEFHKEDKRTSWYKLKPDAWKEAA